MPVSSRIAIISLSLAFAAGLPFWIYIVYLKVTPPDPLGSEQAGVIQVLLMTVAILVGLPSTLLGMRAALREREFNWNGYLVLFLAANAPAIASGCMYPILTWIPWLQSFGYAGPAFGIAMIIGTLLIYALIALAARTIFLRNRAEVHQRTP